MELFQQVSNAQVFYPVAAVAVVLICATLVFIFGFHSAEQPQFDKLLLVVDDRKSANKKRKTKEKKASPNRSVNEDAKTKSDNKKSPSKEKKEEKLKDAVKPKPKEKPAETKFVKKETDVKKGKKSKNVQEAEKPADYDDGEWEEVPKKSEKKKEKVKSDEKKESPLKKNKKKAKDVDVEAAQLPEEVIDEKVKIVHVSHPGPVVDEEADRALQAQIAEVERVLKEAERREQAALSGTSIENDEVSADEDVTDVKDLRSNKKKENKEKQKKKAETVAAKNLPKDPEPETSDLIEKNEEGQNAPVFDELGDTWTDAKVPKKSKKKARKDQ